MTDLINDLKKIASDSTVQMTAGGLALGGFLLNAVFGFGQTTLGLAFQGLTAAVVLGQTVINVAKKQQRQSTPNNQDFISNAEEVQQNYSGDYSYDHQENRSEPRPSVLVQSLISSFFPVTTTCVNSRSMREERAEAEEEKGCTLVQKSITCFFNKVQETAATTCGIVSTPKRKRRNANDDMMDMAYGTGTRDGWTPWTKR